MLIEKPLDVLLVEDEDAEWASIVDYLRVAIHETRVVAAHDKPATEVHSHNPI